MGEVHVGVQIDAALRRCQQVRPDLVKIRVGAWVDLGVEHPDQVVGLLERYRIPQVTVGGTSAHESHGQPLLGLPFALLLNEFTDLAFDGE